jgi:hypothetical protein
MEDCGNCKHGVRVMHHIRVVADLDAIRKHADKRLINVNTRCRRNVSRKANSHVVLTADSPSIRRIMR